MNTVSPARRRPAKPPRAEQQALTTQPQCTHGGGGPGRPVCPQAFVGNRFLGEYDALQRLEDEGQLRAHLAKEGYEEGVPLFVLASLG